MTMGDAIPTVLWLSHATRPRATLLALDLAATVQPAASVDPPSAATIPMAKVGLERNVGGSTQNWWAVGKLAPPRR